MINWILVIMHGSVCRKFISVFLMFSRESWGPSITGFYIFKEKICDLLIDLHYRNTIHGFQQDHVHPEVSETDF